MVLHTQGAGNAHAFLLAANRPRVKLVNPYEAYHGLLDQRPWDDPAVIEDPIHIIFPDAINMDERYRALGHRVFGRSRIAIEINGFVDVKYTVARDCEFPIPKMYTHNPGGFVRQIGKSVWIEKKLGTPIWYRGFIFGKDVRMTAVYGVNHHPFAGNLGKESPHPMITYGCSWFYSKFPVRKSFDKLIELLVADEYQGPFAVCLTAKDGQYWFEDMKIGYGDDEEFLLSMLTEDPVISLLGEDEKYNKGFAITVRATGEDNWNEVTEDMFRKCFAPDMIHHAKNKLVQMLGSPVVAGYGYRFKEAYKNLVAACERYLPGYGYRADAGKRANEWYYNFKQEVGHG